MYLESQLFYQPNTHINSSGLPSNNMISKGKRTREIDYGVSSKKDNGRMQSHER